MSALLRDTPWLNWESPYLHRGHNSCRFATVSPGGLTVEIRFMPEELRLCPGKSHPGSSRWAPVVLKKLKPPGPLPGERRFNTVYPDSMRCLSASLRCGPGGSRCPHRSAAATENRDSVNEALKCLSALTNKTWVRCFNCSPVARWFFITYRST